MAEGITSLDLFFLNKELRANLVNGFFRKIYQYGSAKNKQFLFEIFTKGKGIFWVYFDNRKIFITKNKKAVAQEPPSFCMFLRKHLLNKRIRDVKQHGFDRIIEFSTDDHILIIEMFSDGNVVLCDSSYSIIMPLEIQRWKDRIIRPKEKYKYPPQQLNPFNIDFDEFHSILKKSDKKLIVFLAVRLGLGAVYGKEVCLSAGINENKISQSVTLGETVKLHETIISLEKRKLKPTVYKDFVSPFSLEFIKEKVKEHETFSEALDDFFSEKIVINRIPEKTEKENIGKEKIERIIRQHEESKKKWMGVREESKEIAEHIYNNYATVQSVLSGIKKAKEMGLSWEEIKNRISAEQTTEAEVIKEIKEGDGVVVIELQGKNIELDFRKTIEENAAQYYEDAKWAKKKLEGVVSSEKEHEEKLERIEKEAKKVPLGETEELKEKPKKKRGHWYDKFRWFFTSEGFLVVAGKNATQNENLIKKRLDTSDKVFHANIPGSAFTVIKSQGKEITEQAKREASEFAAAHSKAWPKGLGKIDVFCVAPDQVSKSPPPGQHLQKGSFMIYGEREWYKDTEIKLAIGVKLYREEGASDVISGPVIAVRKNSDYFVTIRPGYKRSMELAKLMKNNILIKTAPEDKFLIEKIPLDEFQRLIPGGMGDLVEFGS